MNDMYKRFLVLLSMWLTVSASCQPGPDGQFSSVQLGGPSNVTAPQGSDVQFICCGGYKWTYEAEDGYTSREIGPHPDATGAPDKRPSATGVLLTSSTTDWTGTVPTTVYTMHDDKGRLILVISNANSRDTGHYRCHGEITSVDAFLVVTQDPHLINGNVSTVIHKGTVVERLVMFPSDQLNKVIIYCPVTGNQTIQSWLWREPILPSSEEYNKLPKGKPPSRTVTTNKVGVHESGHVEIGFGLAWARIRDPLSPEAPVKLWCQFEMPSQWENQEPIVAYYMLDWELYEPINPRVYILQSDQPSSPTLKSVETKFVPGSSDSSLSQTDMLSVTNDKAIKDDPSYLLNQIEQAQVIQQTGSRPILLEHKPARLACQFRIVEDPKQRSSGETQTIPFQQVFWYRNGQQVHVPPFHVDNSQVATAGLSLLNVRAFPAYVEPHQQNDAPWQPREQITCAVTSQVKSNPVYKVTTNASLDVEVILAPRIINKEMLSAERRVDDAVKLTCTALANGPPEMQFEFSQTGQANGGKNVSEWIPVVPRYELSVKRLPVDPKNPVLQRLVLEISNLRRTDHGLYRCNVWNQAGRAQAIGHLLVRSEPQVQVVSYDTDYYVSHKPWRASCHVTGYPLSHETSVTLDSNSLQPNESQTEGNEFSDGVQKSDTSEKLQLPDENEKPVRMQLRRPDGQLLEQAEMKLISYDVNDFLGINATYEIMISPGSGNATVVHCEYRGKDRQPISQERIIYEATQPTKPNISVTCVGPRAVVFSITNPYVTAESPPTERIVTQKVIFAPIDTFQNSANLGTFIVYLDSDGQPSATPTNQSSKPNPRHSRYYGQPTPRPVTIPVKGLMSDTKYVFEWSSGNVFGLSAMEQFTLWTKKIETPPVIKKITFLIPTEGFLQFSTLLDDPCPYGTGARAELSDIVVRYRAAKEDAEARESDGLVGIGEWSEAEVCRQINPNEDRPIAYSVNQTHSGQAFDESDSHRKQNTDVDEQSGMPWSGDRPLTCEFPVADTQAKYEVQVATRNRFDRSEWFTSMYQPALAVHAAAICFPTCGQSGLTIQFPFSFVLSLLIFKMNQ